MSSMILRINLFLSIMAGTYVFASPTPMFNSFNPRDALVTAQGDALCSLWDSVEGSNSGVVWGGGVSSFLNDFLTNNGNGCAPFHLILANTNICIDNWVNNMDRLTTGQGTGASSLRCDSLPGDCSLPTAQCNVFTPPECKSESIHNVQNLVRSRLMCSRFLCSSSTSRITSGTRYCPPTASRKYHP